MVCGASDGTDSDVVENNCSSTALSVPERMWGKNVGHGEP